MQQKYQTFREQYPLFIYKDYHVERKEETVLVTYDFEVPGLTSFHPTLEFPIRPDTLMNDPTGPMARQILFSIGMVELISYWKIACPPRVEIRCGNLKEEQISFWLDLYYGGLGEFFYINNIPAKKEDFMTIEIASATKLADTVEAEEASFHASGKTLIPIGGGKDSVVTVEHLKGKGHNVAFGINPTKASLDTMDIGGFGQEDRFIVKRTLDSEMLRLNQEGYLNGHTPFSALLAFVAYYGAYLLGATHIALSNEASANASTIPGTDINHQYSKTSEFELAFRSYTERFLEPGIYYFSLLRPFAEIAIARSFASYPAYHKAFRSCNRGSKKNIWCCACSKCLFVYTILAPFLSREDMVEMFGEDLFAKEDLLDDWQKLIGVQEVKPFECVGTVEEVQFAVYLLLKDAEKKVDDLPLLLREAVRYAREGLLKELRWDEETGPVSLASPNPLSYWHEDENLPDSFKAYVKDILEEEKE